jgi:quercetin dioxygenase-like cupin family protein
MFKRILVAATLTLAVALPASGQPQDSTESCVPASERAGRTYGCFIVASQDVGRLGPAAVFWQLETFPTAAAATKARSARGSVLEALGKVWLLTIGGSGWRSPGGTHVAEIGPLPIAAGTTYTAQYMEAVFKPGMKSRVHRHSGPEAWLTLSGETCLETPEGTLLGRTGGSHVVVPSGPPMELTATGSEVRRALVLVLHDSSQPPTSPAPDWSPKGLCKVSAQSNSVLFLGNSFTFGYGSPVRFYRSNTVTRIDGSASLIRRAEVSLLSATGRGVPSLSRTRPMFGKLEDSPRGDGHHHRGSGDACCRAPAGG